MRSVEFSPRAEQDLLDIYEYIARDNLIAAGKMLGRIEGVVAKLAEFPGIGHRRRDVRDARHLFFTVRPYVIVYRHDPSALTVARVLHGARDIRQILKDG